MKKVIRLTESDLEQIVKRILKEQYNFISTGAPTQTVPSKDLARYKAAEKKYYCVPKPFAPALDDLIKRGYNKHILKMALGVIGRESSFASGLRYNILNPFKEVWSLLGGDTSVGPAQMKHSTAKDLKLKEGLSSVRGAMDAVYQYLKRSINLAAAKGYTNQKSVNVPANKSLDAKSDLAIASYNSGIGKAIQKFCETKNPKLKAPCDGKKYTKQVKNYLPNYPTKRWDGVDISTHGYVAEVVNKYKKFNCF